jgi:hypothetical protein
VPITEAVTDMGLRKKRSVNSKSFVETKSERQKRDPTPPLRGVLGTLRDPKHPSRHTYSFMQSSDFAEAEENSPGRRIKLSETLAGAPYQSDIGKMSNSKRRAEKSPFLIMRGEEATSTGNYSAYDKNFQSTALYRAKRGLRNGKPKHAASHDKLSISKRSRKRVPAASLIRGGEDTKITERG